MKNSFLRNIVFKLMALLMWAIGVSATSAQVNGSIDTAFGTSGIATNTTVTGAVYSLVGLGDGKVLGAGDCTTSFGSGVCLYRWTSAGVADTTFGFNGVAYVLVTPPSNTGFPKLAVRPDGRIVVAANCGSPAAICVVQSNANGTAFDPSFAGGSFTTLTHPNESGFTFVRLADLALQPDGKLLVGGTCTTTFPTASYCVVRLLPSAQIDITFGTSPHRWSVTTPGAGDVLQKLTLLPDGRYLASGNCGSSAAVSAICVLQYFGNGGFQDSFTVDRANRYDGVRDVRAFGSFVTLSGFSQNSSFADIQILSARRGLYSSFGAVDTSYGGTYPTSGLGGGVNIDSSNDGFSNQSRIMSDGGIVYAGFCNATSALLCLARLAPNGTLDTSFGVGGRYEYAGYALPNNGSTEGVLAEAADGKILLGGACTGSRPCVYRFNDVVQSAPKCSLDIDGDGIVNATTDGLVLLRAMLGFSGATALANAVAPGATRPDWPRVREYLFDQCRMPVPVQ
jgi:uncharacterized delta-60 repeat protein